MAVSRYDAGVGGQQDFASFQSPTSSTTERTGTSQQTSQQAGSTSELVTQAGSAMDAKSMAALQQLIAQLTGGGTEATARETAARMEEANILRALRAGYSKEAAFADAQGAMAQQQRQVMEKLLPSITRASEGAGTSANAMRALLLQDAAARGAEAASALGLKAATDYGGTSVNYSSVLERLLAQSDPTTKALLEALNIAKGAQTSSTTQKEGSSFQTGSQTGATQERSTQQTSGSSKYTDFTGGGAPMYSTTTTPSGSYLGSTGNWGGFEPQYPSGSSYGGASGTLADMLTGQDSWSSYTF